VTNALQILSFCQRESVPHIVLGRGSNVLVSDSGYRGAVINLSGCFCRYKRVEDGVRCGSGMMLPGLVGRLAKEGLSGLEWAVGIPGTVGGAVATNAGAHGSDTSQTLKRLVVMTEGERRVLSKNAISFAYRTAGLAGAVIEVELLLRKDSPERIRAAMDRYMDMRKQTQPVRERTAGCVFKNPSDDSAGRIIDSLGMKGTTVGGATVSELHANFIVNRGSATAADVMSLIERVRERVMEETGTQLELEIELVGEFTP
jgi:UDP-N-acetylmuramate dehydrogenase